MIQIIGSCVIAIGLAVTGICPIDFKTMEFQTLDFLIVFICLVIWNVVSIDID